MTRKYIVLPNEMLQGPLFHCQPVEGRQVIEAIVRPALEGILVKRLVFCPVRRNESMCGLSGKRCWYYLGDGRIGGYQFLGPDMDKKMREDGISYG